MTALIVRVIVNAVALGVATALVEGISIAQGELTEQVLTLLGVAIVFGLLNAFVKPLIKLLALPLFILTLGLITFVINAVMLLLTSWLSGELDLPFRVDGFGAALIGAIIVSLVSFAFNAVLPDRYES